MKKPKLTKRDFLLLNLALDILESDYSGESSGKTIAEIERLRKKLTMMESAL